jgi:hypothetical protein
MGGGNWNSYDYGARVQADKAAGRQTFQHTSLINSGSIAAGAHELLDPKKVATDASPFAGQIMREVCVTDEHPSPTPVAIILDVTASNSAAAKAVHAKLPQLFGALQRIGGISDPQVLIGATGDANSDRVPLQVGNFESDNRIDDMVKNMYLEDGGGGQGMETYELAAYFLAHHTNLETVAKQDRKGYAIFIGDEKPYPRVERHHVKAHIGDELEADIPTKDVFDKLQEQYNVYYLFQMQGMYGRNGDKDRVLAPWKELLNENALVLEDPNNVCEFIAGLLAKLEAGVDDEDLAGLLQDAGFDPAAVQSTSKTLATVGGGGGGVVAKVEGELDVAGDGGAARL